MEKGIIVIQSKKIVIYLIIILSILLLLHILVNIVFYYTGDQKLFGLNPLFNFFYEKNFPTFFSTIILFFSSCLLTIIYYLKKNDVDKYRYSWGLLALIFLFLSLDEILELHEKLSAPMQRLLHILPNSLEYWGWTIPYTIFLIFFSVAYIRFFLHLDKRFKIYFFISALLYILGALFFELIEGLYLTLQLPHITTKQDVYSIMLSFPYFVMVTIEELFEFNGVILFIYSLIEYIKSIPYNISLTFDNLTKK